VIAAAVSRYIVAAIARSAMLTQLFQSSTSAAPVPRNGIRTAPRLTAFSSLPIAGQYSALGPWLQL
jgi:hypothetical protein